MFLLNELDFALNFLYVSVFFIFLSINFSEHNVLSTDGSNDICD
jgi:hypothetical protein